MQIAKNTVVLLRYRLADDAGTVLEDALSDRPVAVLQGQGNVIRGLDRALLGHAAGDRFEISVAPEDGYGLRQDNQIQRVSKKYFAQPNKLRPGMQTQLRTERGQRLVTVHKVGGKVIDVDLNHPLAGQTLHFYVAIDEVREATPAELAHKHAHADGQDHH
jgi:FKBP-type peptidyl-prolyl cis-trans isomerase SlyD